MLKPSSLGDSVVVEFEGGLLAVDFFFAAMVNDDDGKHRELAVDDGAYVTIMSSLVSSQLQVHKHFYKVAEQSTRLNGALISR